MITRLTSLVFLAALCVAFAAPGAVYAEDPTVDEILQKMNEKAESIKDLRADAAVTKYNSTFEEKDLHRLELYYKKPDMMRMDVFRRQKGREVCTEQFITGRDYVIHTWPPNRHGERRKVDPAEMERLRRDSNDPLTFFSRKPEELKAEFNIVKQAAAKAGKVTLVITPKNDKVKFDYKSVEMTVDTATWMPAVIKAMVGGPEDDWSEYTFSKVAVNKGLSDSTFTVAPGVKVEEAKDTDDKQPQQK